MGKTRADYQRAYRERKKKSDPDFLARERARVKSYKIPVAELPKKKQKTLRQKNQEYSRKYRNKKKQQKQESASELNVNFVEYETALPSTSAQNTCVTRRSSSPILIKLNFPTKKRNRKGENALKKANKRISELNSKISLLVKRQQMWKKRYQRAKNTFTRRNITPSVNKPETPRTKTKNDLRRVGVNPEKIPDTVKKQLTLANAVFAEIKQTKEVNKKQKHGKTIAYIVSGEIVKKYRCISKLHREIGVAESTLRKANLKSVEMKARTRMKAAREELAKAVIKFMERDDVSIQMPGKNDVTKADGSTYQTRILSDYLSNVYEKFKSEVPDIKISFSLFCKMRPKYILLTSLISRNTCLCSKHQNMAMKLKALRANSLVISPNPENVSKNVTALEMDTLLENITEDEVVYEEWRRTEIDGKKKMRIVKITKKREDVINIMKKEYEEFLNHVSRVKAQYSALRNLKSNLPNGHLVVQMDFAENFACVTMDEIQSAYWNATSVTLHPTVVYYRSDDNKVDHKNLIYVSDVNHHNSSAVITILHKLLPELKTIFPSATFVHYWTDSPSSQYRNRYIFDLLLKHSERFGLNARWNYFESGHGKGPCDGLGGCAKRQAAEAVKQGKVSIQDASDFFKWAVASQKSIMYRFYSAEEYSSTVQEVSKLKAKVVQGTMKLHAIFPVETRLYIRDISCYCQGCLSGTACCESWTCVDMSPAIENIVISTGSNRDSLETNAEQNDKSTNEKSKEGDGPSSSSDIILNVPKKESFVVANYEGAWYVGKVIDVDQDDQDAHVSFLEKTRGKCIIPTFKWPSRPDKVWIDFDQILCDVDLVPLGKTQRQFRISNDCFDRVKDLV